MRMLITDPVQVLAEHPDVVALRAADPSGSFGILPGHADLLTALSVSVVTWRHQDGRTGCCALRGGVLTVRGGQEVAIATREGQLGEDPDQLEHTVLANFLAAAEADRNERVEAARVHLQAVREIVRILRTGAAGGGLTP